MTKRFEYLQVYLTKTDDGIHKYIAFDGNSECDGDRKLVVLLNKLGQDGWEYCQFISDEGYSITYPHHLLKRSLP